jgi:hypothetical protein
MPCQRIPALAVLAVCAAALGPAAGDVVAGGTYRSPPPVRTVRRTDNTPQERAWSLPAGAPTNRTYTYYAPPAGYEVVVEGTPAEPRVVTVVGPDGRTQTTRLEGPVVTRVRAYVVRPGSR